jgi:hypothetical protein
MHKGMMFMEKWITLIINIGEAVNSRKMPRTQVNFLRGPGRDRPAEIGELLAWSLCDEYKEKS